MQSFSRSLVLIFAVGLSLLLAMGAQFFIVAPTAAQEGTAGRNVETDPTGRPFRLPFAQPSGPDTWMMAQPYGNTTGAYRRRFSTYGASGGIHFGLDLSAPCGTEIVAIADGVVFAVDGPYGSPPHNLMIDHPQLGYASMYGHLLEAPNLLPGQTVERGQVIAQVGDSGETCYSRPHLHLEIRGLDHMRKYNPSPLIDANWDNLALIGSSGRDFARDLTDPRKWQTLYAQPEVQTGGPIVNDFLYPWPFDWSRRAGTAVTPASLIVSTRPETPLSSTTTSTVGRQLTAGDCCTQIYWNEDSTQVRFIDRPGPDEPLGVWAVDVTESPPELQLVTERLGYYSPNDALVTYPDRNKGVAVIERLADGQTWEIDTQERGPSFTPDSQRVIWTTYDEDASRDTREEIIWLANVDGGEPRVLLRASRTDAVAWLADDELLMARRIPGSSDEQFFTLSLEDGRQTDLLQVPEMRGLAISPDNRHLVYYVRFESEAEKNGIWLLDLQNPAEAPQKLPFFGAYRWRDNDHLIYVPFDAEAAEHNFYEYDITSGETRSLFPTGTNLTIANNEWKVSPDGRKIALVAAKGFGLDGIWVLDLY